MYFILQIKSSVVLHTIVYVFTYEHYRLGPDVKKNAILITHWLATMTVNRN
jgi:hypothetical protein